MKFEFNQQQSEYLTGLLYGVMKVSEIADIESGLYRTAAKMKHKFTQPGRAVSLGKKERGLIIEMLAYRHTTLMQEGSFSNELELIEQIIGKIRL